MTTAITGYYSIAQYMPDPFRMEGVNVGVLLFDPGQDYLRVRFCADNHRARRFFKETCLPEKDLDLLKHTVAERVSREALVLRDLEAVRHFLGLFANDIRFTPLRSVRVGNPEVEHACLFEELVGGRELQTEEDHMAISPFPNFGRLL